MERGGPLAPLVHTESRLKFQKKDLGQSNWVPLK